MDSRSNGLGGVDDSMSERPIDEPCCSKTAYDDILKRRAAKAAYDRERREKLKMTLTEEQKSEKRKIAAENAKKRKEKQSEEQRAMLRERNTTYKRIRLTRMSETEATQRREIRVQNDRQRIARQTEAERASNREIDNAAQRERRARRIDMAAINLKQTAETANTDETQITEYSCGKLSLKCFECDAKHFETEHCNTKTIQDESGNDIRVKTFTKCCRNGQIKLDRLADFPEPFRSFMKKENAMGVNFMDNIRSINSSFGFASMGANIVQPKGFGPYCFRVQGQIYHRTGTLHPQDGVKRQYAQLYIMDTEQANNERAAHSANSNVDNSIFQSISDFMENYNPFCKAYKMLYEVEKESKREAYENGIEHVKEVTMAIVQDRTKDIRRYNIARANEVAVVFSNIDGQPPLDRDLLIHLRSDKGDPRKGMKRISILDKNIEPMTYPLLFPYGEQGWGVDLLRNKTGSRTRISQMEYYAYRLSIRDEFNALLNAGKLTQQYIVDAYTKTEGNRLSYILNNQKEWRGGTLKGMQDYVANQAELQGKEVGSVVVLPSSFPGGPRCMQQNYQDAMSIVTKYGKPDLFVTVTCNPKWKEITENLEKWQSSEHRPDLVARVFNLKFKKLLEEITNPKGGIFGKVIGYVYVIEFQKRGLPHAHILLILDKDSKLDDEQKIDTVVRAEIPERERFPRLFDIVTSHMVHGPCGIGTKSVCMEGDKCLKKFPRPFQERTLGNGNINDGYALYKRRKLNPITTSKGKLLDNSWIVPYNPYLLLRYNCHINIEVCASVQSVKYLFKYVYKGHDCANVQLKDPNVINQNEIQKHVDSRYVSAPEAAWRLSGNDMHGQSHSVERLAVHLPGEQYIIVSAETQDDVGHEGENNIVRQIRNAENKNTTLTGWFELNRTDANARQFFYWETPLYYTWLKTDRKWKIRERFFNKIGRMYTVNPKDSERFYLRLLLLHVKGAISFEDLRSFDGVVYDTFRESAKARGFLLDDDIWQKTLDDAIVLQMPSQLRQIFAYICAYCSPSDPSKLWEDNKKDFLEDICLRRHQNTGDCRCCESLALRDLKRTLDLLGVSFVVRT